jgi:hypothetical protein
MRIASFDIGKKNFAFYIEEFDRAQLLSLKNIPPQDRYNPDGTPTKKMAKLLHKICMNGRTVLHKNLDLTENCDKSMRLDPETYHNMIDVLDSFIPEWDKCHAFIVEKQMEFAKKALNIPAVKLGQHCYSYFCFKYGRTKQVVEFSAQHKGKVLGTPKMINPKKPKFKNGKDNWCAMPKPKRKKFAVKQAIELLTARKEEHVLQGIKTVSKKDDLADTLLQLQAFKYLTFVEKEL